MYAVTRSLLVSFCQAIDWAAGLQRPYSTYYYVILVLSNLRVFFFSSFFRSLLLSFFYIVVCIICEVRFILLLPLLLLPFVHSCCCFIWKNTHRIHVNVCMRLIHLFVFFLLHFSHTLCLLLLFCCLVLLFYSAVHSLFMLCACARRLLFIRA